MIEFKPYMNNTRAYFPIMNVKPNYSTIYYVCDSKLTHKHNDNSLKNLHCNKNFGWLSETSKKNIRKAINLLLYLSPNQIACMVREKKQIKFRITFVTLTLPSTQIHSDKEITQICLHDFLNILRNDYNMIHYVWKAEKQNNGNIHYHLTTNIFIHHEELRSLWNQCVEVLGYVSMYQKKMKEYHSKGFRLSDNEFDKRSEQEQYNAYLYGIKTNWRSPNSTDVHSVKNIGSLAAYIAEYFTKNPLSIDDTDTYLKAVEKIKQTTRTIKLLELQQKDRDDYSNNYIVTLNEIIDNNKAERNRNEVIISSFQKYFIQGRVWYLSRTLSGFDGKIQLDTNNFSEELEYYVNNNKNKLKNTDNCTLLLSTINELSVNGCKSIKDKYDSMLNDYINNKLIERKKNAKNKKAK